jgi:3-phenylpropionate/trans-cinnamate dioxygenase ferredoxin component
LAAAASHMAGAVIHFVSVGAAGDFQEGKMRAFRLGETEIAVALVKGRFHAFSNICTHRFAYLSDGFLIDGQIVCGEHEATYDPATGAILYGPAFEPLPVYPVRIDGDEVKVGWPEVVQPDAVVAIRDEEDRI